MIQNLMTFDDPKKAKMTLDKLTLVFFLFVLLYRPEFTFPSVWGLFIKYFSVKDFYICYKYNFLY